MKITHVKVVFEESDTTGEVALPIEDFAKLFVAHGFGPYPGFLGTRAEHERRMAELEERFLARAAKKEGAP